MPILHYLIILLQAQYLKEQGTETLYCQGLKAYKDKFVQLKLSAVARLAKTMAVEFLADSFAQYEKMFMSHKFKIQKLVDTHLETEQFFPMVLASLNRTLLLELEVTLQPSLIETHDLYCKLGKKGEQLYETLILLPGLKNAFRKAEKSFTADLRASDFLTKDHESTLRDLFEKHYRAL
jgi:hypothetical protein